MTVRVCVILGLIGAMVALPRETPAATPEQVAAAIDKAKAFLYSKQKGDNWEFTPKRNTTGAGFDEAAGQWGGVTAICAYSLLAAGDNPRDGKLKDAIEWLKRAKIVGVYALGVRCQVWLLLPQTDEIKKLAQNDALALQDGFYTNPTAKAKFLYGYQVDKKTVNDVDHSVSQFGVLGSWACEQIRPETIPALYWKNVDDRWSYDQQSDGGWFYRGGPAEGFHGGTQASMTAAGVATLYITQDYVHPEQYTKCNGNIVNPHIEAGVKYLADHQGDWTPDVVFGAPAAEWYTSYTLYGIERIGVAGGLKYIGTTDWFQYGADWLIAHQSSNGAWRGDGDIDNTALSILFLARGSAPILVNKVQYNNATGKEAGKPGHWNERPRDVANFVRWVGRQNERDLAWQITNLDVPEVELHDAPFLWIAGNQALNLTDDQKNKLRQYCRQGGMILFNTDCGGGTAESQSPFLASVIKLGTELFPDSEFRDLPAEHPIYSGEVFARKRWKQPPTIKGLSNGVRDLMLILPDDPARSFQLQQTNGTGHEEAYQSIDDIMQYGTDKQPLPPRGSHFLIVADPNIQADKKLTVGRLKYSGNWDPEPGGWTRLTALLHNNKKIDLTVTTVDPTGPFPPEMKVLHMTGTTHFNLKDDQKSAVKKFLDDGGTLIVDAAGGSSEFAQSAEALVQGLSGSPIGDPLPLGDDLFKAYDPKVELKYRAFARPILGVLKGPQLRAVTMGNRPAIYYSRQDLSGGLVGENVDGIYGYDPASSTAIVAGILMRAVK